jgi:hypothetical protein
MSDHPVAKASIYTGQHNRQISIPSAGFETAIPATKRPHTYAFDREAIGVRSYNYMAVTKPTNI